MATILMPFDSRPSVFIYLFPIYLYDLTGYKFYIVLVYALELLYIDFCQLFQINFEVSIPSFPHRVVISKIPIPYGRIYNFIFYHLFEMLNHKGISKECTIY